MQLPRTLVILLELAAAVVVAGGIRAAAWLVAPVFLALVIVITVHPVHARLRARGLPSWAATTLLVLAVYGVLVVLAGVVVVSVARLATLLPSYAAEVNALLASVTAELARFGVGAEQLRELAGTLNYGRLVGIVSGLLLGITSLLGNLVFLLSLLLFLSIEASGAGTRHALLARDRAPIAAAFTGFTRATRRYMGVNTVFGLLTGLIDAVVLALMGVPLAVLWGLLVFITNYIPYIGFWIALVPPVLLALLTGGWGLAIGGVRAVHRGELRADVGDPAQVRRRRGGDLGVAHPRRAGVLGLAARHRRGGPGRAADAVREGADRRRQPEGPVGERDPRLHADGPRRHGRRRDTAGRRRPAAGPIGRPVGSRPGYSMMSPSPGET